MFVDAERRKRREIDEHDRAEHGPTRAVPCDWTRNRPIRMTIAIGMTSGSSAGLTTVRPSTADRTEIAGVIIASP